jgi:hypothetical protein
LLKNADGVLSPFIFQTSSLTIILTVALNGEFYLLRRRSFLKDDLFYILISP